MILQPETRLSYFYSKSFKHSYISVLDIHIFILNHSSIHIYQFQTFIYIYIYHYSGIYKSPYTTICKHKHIYTPKVIIHQVLMHIIYNIQDALYVYQI
jgi:hypothetical protein